MDDYNNDMNIGGGDDSNLDNMPYERDRSYEEDEEYVGETKEDEEVENGDETKIFGEDDNGFAESIKESVDEKDIDTESVEKKINNFFINHPNINNIKNIGKWLLEKASTFVVSIAGFVGDTARSLLGIARRKESQYDKEKSAEKINKETTGKGKWDKKNIYEFKEVDLEKEREKAKGIDAITKSLFKENGVQGVAEEKTNCNFAKALGLDIKIMQDKQKLGDKLVVSTKRGSIFLMNPKEIVDNPNKDSAFKDDKLVKTIMRNGKFDGVDGIDKNVQCLNSAVIKAGLLKSVYLWKSSMALNDTIKNNKEENNVKETFKYDIKGSVGGNKCSKTFSIEASNKDFIFKINGEEIGKIDIHKGILNAFNIGYNLGTEINSLAKVMNDNKFEISEEYKKELFGKNIDKILGRLQNKNERVNEKDNSNNNEKTKTEETKEEKAEEPKAEESKAEESKAEEPKEEEIKEEKAEEPKAEESKAEEMFENDFIMNEDGDIIDANKLKQIIEREEALRRYKEEHFFVTGVDLGDIVKENNKEFDMFNSKKTNMESMNETYNEDYNEVNENSMDEEDLEI